jgi:hypothetical protein
MSTFITSRTCSSIWTMAWRATADARKSHAPYGGMCPALSPHPTGVLSTVPRVAYNPNERCWSSGTALEWRLAGFARGRDGSHASAMTWKGNHPLVTLVTTTYQTGVKLTKKAMQAVETQRSSITAPGQVLRGYSLFLTICPGWFIILASFRDR